MPQKIHHVGSALAVVNAPLNSEKNLSYCLAEVERRAYYDRDNFLGEPRRLLDIALNHLTFAWVGLIRAILGVCPNSGTGSLPVGTSSGIEPKSKSRESTWNRRLASIIRTAASSRGSIACRISSRCSSRFTKFANSFAFPRVRNQELPASPSLNNRVLKPLLL